MNRLKKVADFLWSRGIYLALLVMCILRFVSSTDETISLWNDTQTCVLCGLAFIIIIRALYLLILRRILLDRILSGSRFFSLFGVIFTIIAVPVFIYGVARIRNFSAGEKLDNDGRLFADELMFAPEIYRIDSAKCNTRSHGADSLCLSFARLKQSDSIVVRIQEEAATASPDYPTLETVRASENNVGKPHSPSLLWSILYHFTDPGNQHMTTTEQGRRWALIIALLGSCLMSGVLVSSLTNFFDRRANDYCEGLSRYLPQFLGLPLFPIRWYFGRFVVIVGGHRSLAEICRKLQNDATKKIDTIFVLTSDNVPALRNALRSAQGIDESKIVLYYGNRGDNEELDYLFLEHSEAIYVLGENGDEPQHDVLNMKCLQLIANKLHYENKNDTLSENPDPNVQKEDNRKSIYSKKLKPCYMLFEYQTTFSVLQSADTPGIIHNIIEFLPYSYYENWAQKVLITNADPAIVKENHTVKIERYGAEVKMQFKHYKYAPLDGKGIGIDSKEYVHLVVVGMSKMGIALAIEAAHIAHYPNYVKDERCRTRITFIDANVDSEMQFFMSRFKPLFSLSRWRYGEADMNHKGQYFKSNSPSIFANDDWNDPVANPHSACSNPDNYNAKEESLEKKNFIDIEWEFIKGNVESPDVQRYLIDCANNVSGKSVGNDSTRNDSVLGEKLTVAICLPLANESIAASLYLPAEVYIKCLQVLVYQNDYSAIIDDICGRDLFANTNSDFISTLRYSKLHPFGMLSYGDMSGLDNQHMAHKVSRIYDVLNSPLINTNDPVTVMREYIAHSEEHPLEWQSKIIWDKWSNIYNANSIQTKQRSITASNFDQAPIENAFSEINKVIYGESNSLMCDHRALHKLITADTVTSAYSEKFDTQIELLKAMTVVEHNRWNVEKLLMGYRPLSIKEEESIQNEQNENNKAALRKEYKNGVKKAHSCICSFNHLKDVNPATIDYDVAFTLMLPYLQAADKRS